MTEPNSALWPALPDSLDLAPLDYIDPVIEFYKKKIDRVSLRENLTVDERLRKAQARVIERAASFARLAELDEFRDFTSRLLDSTTEPLSLDRYLLLWREHQATQASVASIRQNLSEDDAGLSALNEVRSRLGVKE